MFTQEGIYRSIKKENTDLIIKSLRARDDHSNISTYRIQSNLGGRERRALNGSYLDLKESEKFTLTLI